METKLHVVVAGPGQWGQMACVHLLQRVSDQNLRITLLVPRRYEQAFSSRKPVVAAWAEYGSVRECVDKLREDGKPIHYVFDDQLGYFAATLADQRSSKEYTPVGYITTSGEEHYLFAQFLARYCSRVLIEKPISKVAAELDLFRKLVQRVKPGANGAPGCEIRVAEHYLFRPGLRSALAAERELNLEEFLKQHEDCNLKYEFRFLEKADREDPASRLSAFQDGAILDVLAPHGLGPLVQYVLPALGVANIGAVLEEVFDKGKLRTWSAMTESGRLHVPVLAETAARFRAEVKLGDADQTLELDIRSGKGQSRYDRFFRVLCSGHRGGVAEVGEESLEDRYFGVSLGQAGFSLRDKGERESDGGFGPGAIFYDKDGGYRFDLLGEATSEAANAQASMINGLLMEEFPDERAFLPVDNACEIVRFGMKLQKLAAHVNRFSYRWGTDITDSEWDEVATPSRALTDAAVVAPEGSLSELFRTLALPNSARLSLGDESAASEPDVVQEAQRDWEPFAHIVTILGSEGSGRTEIAKQIHEDCERSEVLATLVHVPRATSWDERVATAAASQLTLQRVITDIAAGLEIGLRVGPTPEESLREVLQGGRYEFGDRVLIVNGIDRLDHRVWPKFVEVVALLPARVRVVMLTSRSDQLTGSVFFVDSLRDPKLLDRAMMGVPRTFSESLKSEDLEEIQAQIGRSACGNLEAAGLMGRYLSIVRHPELPGDNTLSDRLKLEIAAIALPRGLNSDGQAQGRRVADVIFSSLDRHEAQAASDLARLPGRIPWSVGEITFRTHKTPQGLLRSVIAWEDGNGFGVPNPIRYAAIARGSEERLASSRVVSIQRLFLQASENSQSSVIARVEQGPDLRYANEEDVLVRAFLNLDLAKIRLYEGPFESFVVDMFTGAELAVATNGSAFVLPLLRRFLEVGEENATSLSALGYAMAHALYGRFLQESVAHIPARANLGLKHIKTGYWIAAAICRVTADVQEHSDDDRGFCAGLAPDSKLDAESIRISTLAAWKMAMMMQEGWYAQLLDARDSEVDRSRRWPRVRDPQWRQVRTEWEDLSLDTPNEVSVNAFAIVHRTKAFESARKAVSSSGNEAAGLWEAAINHCRKAAELNDQVSLECALRNRIEEALFLRRTNLDRSRQEWERIWGQLDGRNVSTAPIGLQAGARSALLLYAERIWYSERAKLDPEHTRRLRQAKTLHLLRSELRRSGQIPLLHSLQPIVVILDGRNELGDAIGRKLASDLAWDFVDPGESQEEVSNKVRDTTANNRSLVVVGSSMAPELKTELEANGAAQVQPHDIRSIIEEIRGANPLGGDPESAEDDPRDRDAMVREVAEELRQRIATFEPTGSPS